MSTQKLNQCRKLQSLEIINHLPLYFGGIIGWHGIVYFFCVNEKPIIMIFSKTRVFLEGPICHPPLKKNHLRQGKLKLTLIKR